MQKLLHWRRLLVVAVVSVAVHFLQINEAGRKLEIELARKAEFKFRAYIDASPKIHPKLKIYGLDDPSVSLLQAVSLSLRDWAEVINTLAKSKPAFVFIDKVFRIVPEEEQKDVAAFVAALRQGPPVVVGGFGRDAAHQWMKELSMDWPQFDPVKYIDDPKWYNFDAPRRGAMFGPHDSLAAYFAKIGHINYDGSGRIAPFLNVRGKGVVPHAGLLLADELKFEPRKVNIQGHEVSLDDDGLLPVNFASRETFNSNVYSMVPLVAKARKGQTMMSIDPGDVVVILPMYYTGNTDIGATPIGQLPRGLIPATLFNSTLTGQWLQPIRGRMWFVLVGAFLGILLAGSIRPVWYWLAATPALMAYICVSMLLFAYQGLVVPWLYPSLSFVVTGLFVFAEKVYLREITSRTLEQAFNGLIPRELVEEIKNNPDAIRTEASEELMTVMFLDIVGFSTYASTEPPKVVFEKLKKTLNRFSAQVHAHGGVVDKTLGDGMLAFFGYNYTGRKTATNHADDAIACALAIQKEHLDESLKGAKSGEPMMPLRIGINTASVYVGDIGDHQRLDFTVIGDGVNFAQRLESACSPYAINLSEQTLEAATTLDLSCKEVKRLNIRIKHQAQLVEAYELNPFYREPAKLQKAIEIFRNSRNLIRKYTRRRVFDPERLVIGTHQGQATLVDFSKTGFSIRLGSYLSRGVELPLKLSAPDVEFSNSIMALKLSEVVAEVRWSKPAEDGFLHGVQIIGVSEEQQEALYQALRKLFQRQGAHSAA